MKNSLFRYVCLVVSLLICSFADAQQKANYKLAEKFRLLEQNPIIKYSTEVKPTFINGTDCFYYSFTTREGKKYYYVNPKKKEKRLLFDTAELLSKIAVYTKKAYSSADPYLSFTFMKDNETIRIDFDRGLYTYNIHTKALKQLNEKPSYGNSDPYWMKYSPDSLYFLYASKDNLYFVGNQKKGQDTIPVQLTTDGEPNYTFNREDEGKLEGRFGAESTHWIPGSHRFYAVREDNRKVRDLWLINSLSTPYPTLKTYKAELAGDKHVTQYELLIGDVDTREVKKIDINRWPDQYIDILYISKDGKRLYFQRYNRPWNQSDICEVDVIVGTRGETEEYFGQAYEFIKSLDVTQLHVFSYSERPGTQALKIDHVVAPEEKHRRSQQLLELSDEKTRAFYARHIGQTMPVLLERPKPGLPMHGFTPNYIRVEVPHDAALDNQLVSVRLGDFNADGTALLGAIE